MGALMNIHLKIMKNSILSKSLLALSISAISQTAFSATGDSVSQSSVQLDNQQITGALYRDPVSAAAFNVSIIERADLNALPVNNLIEALEYVSGIDVRQRGTSGIQADIGIRGSTYEQTLVLLDGVRMNDPQTGHHNMDLPIAFEDIERIEIVKGPGAGQYGPSSNGGVINIVSRKSVDDKEAAIKVERGSFDFERYALSLAKTEGEISQFLNGNHAASGSYIRDEALRSRQGQGNYRVVHQGEVSTSQLGLGYLEKDFGAYRFYVPTEAQSTESTSQRHAYATNEYRFSSDSRLESSVSWRNHFDAYKYTPASKPNEHESEATQMRIAYSLDRFTVGGEHNQENLDSSRDGVHGRHFSSVFALYTHSFGNNFNLTGNLSYLDYDSQEGYVLPVVGADWVISESAELYINSGKSVRTPTLNDLYLAMASDMGNEDLAVEKTTSSELGFRAYSALVNLNASVFYKQSEDVIDFTKTDTEVANSDPFIARNYGDTDIKGYDLEVDASAYAATQLGLSIMKATHTRVIQDIDTDLAILKNTDGQLQTQSALMLGLDIADYWQLVGHIKREDRFNSDYYEVLDVRLGYDNGNLSAALEGTNLLDAEYVDAGFVEVPGPGIRLEVGYKL